MTHEELAAYILMERIKPAPQTASLIRNGVVTEVWCVCRWRYVMEYDNIYFFFFFFVNFA